MKNTGHSPALNVFSRPEMFLVHNPQIDPESEANRFCAQTKEMAPHAPETETVFPSRIAPGASHAIQIGANRDAVQKGMIFDDFIDPTAILCIVYQSAVDDSWHQTAMIFDMYKACDGGGI
ncbi:MAG TPA: hypothetical protein VGT04_14945, partial [Acidobacteriaceae bacterium]|nr:hypothetical protein [Acidobacteriaceae bacterium]